MGGLVTFIRHSLRSRSAFNLMLVLLGVIFFVGLWYDYETTGVRITVVYDGDSYEVVTHQRTVAGVLADAGVKLAPGDLVAPEPSSIVQPGEMITVRPALSMLIEADGQFIAWRTQKRTPIDVFAEAGIAIGPHDEIWVDGRPQPSDVRLSALSVQMRDEARGLRRAPWDRSPLPPVRLALKRAATLYLDNGGVPSTIYTTAATIGKALHDRGIILYLGDKVIPGLSNRVSNGLRVYIQRSKAVELAVDGHLLHTRTRGDRVADVLAQQGVTLTGKDFVEPPETTIIREGMGIRVCRVAEALMIEQDSIPYETVWRPRADLELDQQRLEQEGQEGLTKRRVKVVYQDGQEVERRLVEEWVESDPQTKIILYGTKIVPREIETDTGRQLYWRKIRMLATSYSPATSGKSPDHPQYGVTRSGMPVQRGVVAVDAKVIGLGEKLYIPGYGTAVAADTGGRVKGRRIDLGFSDNDFERWYRWVDVFVLGPGPASGQVRWVLPNWPREGR